MIEQEYFEVGKAAPAASLDDTAGASVLTQAIR